jgi:hypothetical protein
MLLTNFISFYFVLLFFIDSARFTYSQVEVVTATLDLSEVRSYRGAVMSRCKQAAQAKHIPRVDLTEFSV